MKENRLSQREAGRPLVTMHPSGQYRAIWVTLRQLIMTTYGVRAYQIIDAPDWVAQDRFDIVARAPENFEMGQANAMVRTLLEGRFGLVVRKQVRPIPSYSLEWVDRRRRPGAGDPATVPLLR